MGLMIEPTWSPRQKRNLATLVWQAAWISRRAIRLNFGGILTGRTSCKNLPVFTPMINKTLIIKEGDKLLYDSSLLAEARELYDKGT